jgi:hypothetical protein
MRDESFIQQSVQYLNSPEAFQSIEKNPYNPKWDSPWWHMSLLYEMGESARIPKATAEKLLLGIRAKFKVPDVDTICPCMIGNIYQILSSAGVDVDSALPWAREYFVKFQMKDGGMSCDEEAYACPEHNASSMVAVMPCLESVLGLANPTSQELEFLDRGAKFLFERELRLGSKSNFNKEEREDEEDWLKLTFPRFYFYDVLRGLNFILKWAQIRKQTIPKGAIEEVVKYLESSFPDGKVRIGRQGFYNIYTGSRPPVTYFPLLDQVSHVGEVSTYLTKKWVEAKQFLE